MTAEEWDASTSLRELLADCGLPDGDRRLRLFSAACARRVAAVMPDDRARGLVDLAEARADGGLSDGDWLRAVFETVDPYIGNEAARDRAGGATFGVLLRLHQTDTDSILRLAESVVEVRAYLAYTGGYPVAVGADECVRRAVEAESLELCRLFRCLCGCPSRRPRFAPQWRTDTAVSLARQMYDSRDFGAMPILADALQDAGCDDADVLSHCRTPGPHAPGCRVVDLVGGLG